MALPEPTTLATAGSAIVAIMSGIMAYLGWRSYQRTGNIRLIFVVVAFTTFVLKSFFVAYNVNAHAVPHDSIEFVSAMFDVIIVMMLFVPFFLNGSKR